MSCVCSLFFRLPRLSIRPILPPPFIQFIHSLFVLMVIISGFIFPILSPFVAIILPFSFVICAVLALPMPMPPIRRCSADGVPALFPCNPSRESGRLVFVCAGDLSLGCEQFDGAPKLEKAPLEMLQKTVRVEERRETRRTEKELPLFVSTNWTTSNASPATTTAKTATTMAFEGAMAMPAPTNSVSKSVIISTAPPQGSATPTPLLTTLMATNLPSLPLALPSSPGVSFVVRNSSSGTISEHNGKTNGENDGTAKAEQKEQQKQKEARSSNTTTEEGGKSAEKAMTKTEKAKMKTATTTTKLIITISAKDNGTLINGAKGNGTLINGASNATLENATKGNGTLINGANGNGTLINCASNATLKNGDKGNGTLINGASNGTLINGAKDNGTLINGASNATFKNGTKGNGTLINDAKSNGTLINGAKDNGTLINGASNATLETGANGNVTFRNCANGSASTESGICAGNYILANNTKENDILRNGTKDKDNGTYTDNEIFMNGTIANGTLETAKGNDTLINGSTTTTVLPSKIMAKSTKEERDNKDIFKFVSILALRPPLRRHLLSLSRALTSSRSAGGVPNCATTRTTVVSSVYSVPKRATDAKPTEWTTRASILRTNFEVLLSILTNGRLVRDSSMRTQCFDKGKDCPRVAFLCRTIAYGALMANECAKTCGQCDGGAPEEGEKAAKGEEKEREKPKSSGDRQRCEVKDNYPRCAVWRLQGFCTSPKYSKYLKSRYCAKTCTICEGGDDDGSGRK
ncbi:hypothetical protein niasHT_007530 [Heterodera trifolii]|uniref:ShKT domain-containing protein n=1 Tax=Heterodera trifolii TaxID=157864 RepID=A0ABD2LPE8_9BILA